MVIDSFANDVKYSSLVKPLAKLARRAMPNPMVVPMGVGMFV